MREKEVVVTPDEVKIITKPMPIAQNSEIEYKLDVDYKENFNSTMQVNIPNV